jgi:hypothetical protein
MNQNRWKKCILIESNQNKNQNASKWPSKWLACHWKRSKKCTLWMAHVKCM